jgi:hypothetical protein
MLFRMRSELRVCVYRNEIDIGFVSFVIALVVFYLDVVGIGYCVLFLFKFVL